MRRAFSAVALIAFAVLFVRAAAVGLAGDYVDPVSRITAQDEALYGHSAIAMAQHGDWLTPRFMGRFALYKPPLLAWSAGLSARILGVSRISLRLPSVLLAALAAGLIFLWAAEVQSWQAGVAAVILLLSNRLWVTLGALCMTDALLVAFSVAAFYALFADPWLESRAALFGFSGAVAAAILTKGIAGLVLPGVLGLYWLAAPRKYRPTFTRVCMAGALALAFALPWFAYQALAHQRWFWAEHIGVEILGYGAGAPPQTSREPQALFYLARLAAIDPVLIAVTAAALPMWVDALRRREPSATLLACWIGLTATTLMVWQYRNASYLLPLIPALAIVAAGYSPFAQRRYAPWMIVCLAAGFLVKWTAPEMPWSLALPRAGVQPLAAPLSAYCEQQRGNELVVLNLADDLYAAVLPLPRLRYAAVNPAAASALYGMPFEEMGITVSVDQFNRLPELTPQYRDRLRQWGVNGSDAIGTLIVARSEKDFAALVSAHPEMDFLTPLQFVVNFPPSAHDLTSAGPDYLFLLSRARRQRADKPAWTCRM